MNLLTVEWKVGVVFSNARSTDCFAPERPTTTKLGLTNNRLTAPTNELYKTAIDFCCIAMHALVISGNKVLILKVCPRGLPRKLASSRSGLPRCLALYGVTTRKTTVYHSDRVRPRNRAVLFTRGIAYSKKEKNTENFTPTFLFSSKKKFFSATAQLSPAESSSKGVFRRVLHHNIEFLSISTLIFYIHTLSTTKKFISMALCNIIRKTQCYGLGL